MRLYLRHRCERCHQVWRYRVEVPDEQMKRIDWWCGLCESAVVRLEVSRRYFILFNALTSRAEVAEMKLVGNLVNDLQELLAMAAEDGQRRMDEYLEQLMASAPGGEAGAST